MQGKIIILLSKAINGYVIASNARGKGKTNLNLIFFVSIINESIIKLRPYYWSN